ncbi:putative membrane protein [Oryzihumus leptocrescens]|uniref:Putative membrane protein n=2 Tax=Oryzihumus leptocrescens TaxID=297536 RepID=A0A542ZN99_9MICO|nr:putative membrane protein [Oryzihumus leptocrescens]
MAAEPTGSGMTTPAAPTGPGGSETGNDTGSTDVAARGPGRLRRLGHVTLPGSWGALLAGCLSFTPSLLPRGGLIQGLVWGITAAIGYGLGVVGGWVWRAFADREARSPRSWAWPAFLVSSAVLVPLSFGLGQYWQHQIRALMGVTDYNVALVVLSPFVAAVTFAVILLIGRGLRRLYRWAAGLLTRWVGPRAARAVGWVLVVGLTWLVVSGLLLDGFVAVADKAFSLRDTTTAEGVHQPTTALRAGGPGSVVPWDTLGYQGRTFAGLGPSPTDIEKVTGHSAMEPIRVYAGLASAPDAEARAALAVRDLQRAGGFARKNLLVVTTTGSGWVDPALVDTFEYLTGGNSATVAIQYSYLPSWISYLVDQSKAREAGRALFDAVYDPWSKLPAGQRPRLFVAGESLGSFGGETAFSGEYDLRNRTNGTLFAGPPNFNTLFREFSDNRAPASPEIQPVYKDGRTVRFTSNPAAGIPPQDQPWSGSRVLYLMHPSDPIVWWSPNLILHRPAWMSELPGKDVLAGIVWIPFVSFWQVTADLPFSTGVPPGHGHKYTSEYVDGWAAVLQPAGVTEQELAAVRQAVANVD